MTPDYHIYILLLSNRQLYAGYTTDLARRMAEHVRGAVESTRHRRPIELIHTESYVMESDARRREAFLKTTEGKRLLKRQLRDVLQARGVLLPERDAGTLDEDPPEI